jgi:hypothetical protein
MHTFLGENQELINVGLNYDHKPSSYASCTITSTNLAFIDPTNSLDKIEFKIEHERKNLYGIFFEKGDNGYHTLNDNKILNDKYFRELYCNAMCIHILSHLFTKTNSSDIFVDIMLIESRLGLPIINIVIDKLAFKLIEFQKHLLSKSRIMNEWNQSSYLFYNDVVFYYTADSYNVTLGFMLNTLMLINDLFPRQEFDTLIELIKESITVNINQLGWIEGVHKLSQRQYHTAPYYGYGYDDLVCAKAYVAKSDNYNRYYQASNTNFLQLWIQNSFGLNIQDYPIHTSFEFLVDKIITILKSNLNFCDLSKLDCKRISFDSNTQTKIHFTSSSLTITHDNVDYRVGFDGVINYYDKLLSEYIEVSTDCIINILKTNKNNYFVIT